MKYKTTVMKLHISSTFAASRLQLLCNLDHDIPPQRKFQPNSKPPLAPLIARILLQSSRARTFLQSPSFG
jgi:hypothetical protein